MSATDSQIVEFVKADMGVEIFSVSSIETGKADKYGVVRHVVYGVATFADGALEVAFDCKEYADGELFSL